MKLPYAQYAKAKDFTCLGTWTLLTGPEHFYKQEALARMKAEVMAAGEATWEVLEGPEATVRALQQRSQTLGLFGGARGTGGPAAGAHGEGGAGGVGAAAGAEEARRTRPRAFPPLSQRNRHHPVTGEKRGPPGEDGEGGLGEGDRQPRAGGGVPGVEGRARRPRGRWRRAKELGKKLEPAAANRLDRPAGRQRAGATGLGTGEARGVRRGGEDHYGRGRGGGDAATAGRERLSSGGLRGHPADRAGGGDPAECWCEDQRQEPMFLLALLAGAIREIWQVKLLVDRGWRQGRRGGRRDQGDAAAGRAAQRRCAR